MIKVDLHIHTGDDPIDHIPYSTTDLIDRAAALGFGAVAITLHERQLDLAEVRPYAASRGLALIPGIEQRIEGKHVLLINFSAAAEQVHTFADLVQLKALERGLVIAPHPFFPSRSCLWSQLERHAGLFDAVEYNGMVTPHVNFNARAIEWARAHGRPMVGNGDVHRLRQLGSAWSYVDAPADSDAICDAIKTGRVRYGASALSWRAAAGIMTELFACPLIGLRGRRKPASGSTSISQPQNA